MKVVMAVSGLFLIAFLLMHSFGNIKVFFGEEAFDHYAHWLKSDILYPLMPEGWFIWIFRAAMLLAIGLHMASAWHLARRAKAARGTSYVNKKTLQETYAARTMRWGGVILVTFLVFHLLQFTAQVIVTGWQPGAGPYDMFVATFQQWWLVLAYGLWLVTVCMHVRHGTWSAMATLGANTSAKTRSVLNGVAWFLAILIFVWFMSGPIAVLVGVVK